MSRAQAEADLEQLVRLRQSSTNQTLSEMGIGQQEVDYAFAFATRWRTYGLTNDSVPVLAKADPTKRGLLIGGLDPSDAPLYSGNWDLDTRLPLESTVKLLTQGYSLQELGVPAETLSRRERPGEAAFNVFDNIATTWDEPSGVADASHPFYNQGGISSSDFVFDDFLNWVRDILGDQTVDYSVETYESEISCDYNNREIAKRLAQGPGQRFGDDVDVALERADNARHSYTKACSIEATLPQLLRFGQMLANDGVDIYTGNQVLSSDNARRIIVDMSTGGMYKDSTFYFDLSKVPGKSSISGLVLGVVHGRGAFVAYDPTLGLNGNSNMASAALYSAGRLLLPDDIPVVGEDQARQALFDKQDQDEVALYDVMVQTVLTTGRRSRTYMVSGAKRRKKAREEEKKRVAHPLMAAMDDYVDSRGTESPEALDFGRAGYSPEDRRRNGSMLYCDAEFRVRPDVPFLRPELSDLAFVRSDDSMFRGGDYGGWDRYELSQRDGTETPLATEGHMVVGVFDVSDEQQRYAMSNRITELALSKATVIRVIRQEDHTYQLLAA
jgi:glutaminase